MNNFITEIVHKIESFFWNGSSKDKGWFIFALIIVAVNALIIASFRDLTIYSNGSFKFGWLKYFNLIGGYSLRDYIIFAALFMAYKVPKDAIQDEIWKSLRSNNFHQNVSDFDYSKHLRFNKKFRFKNYMKYLFSLVIISFFFGAVFVPGETNCYEIGYFDRYGFKVDDPYKNFGEELNEDNYDRFYESFSQKCIEWDSFDIYPDRFGREIIHTKDNIHFPDYVLQVFLWFLPFFFFGVRQGIWRKTESELIAENRSIE